MAQYVFEQMAQSDAAAFTTADILFFLSGNVGNIGVVDTPQSTTTTALGTSTTFESIALTSNGKTLTFSADALSYASQHNHVVINNDVLMFGKAATADTLDLSTAGSAGHAAVAFGFDGNDTITGSAANDTINGGDGNDVINNTASHAGATESDWLLGGNGADSITGGAANEHIYGNVAVGAAGTGDGNDTIHAGAGHDYVNGNAGDDSIFGEDGNDRLYGGNGNDSIDGGNGNDYLQGNKGNDTLKDTGTSTSESNTIHGGAGNDIISADHGSNWLYGDTGADSIVGGDGADHIWGGTGYDTLTGGTGNDVFNFAAGDADIGAFSASVTGAAHGQTDVITDWSHGNDTLAIGFSVTAVDTAAGGTTFATVDDAYTYAKGILAGHGTEVAELFVNDSTNGHVGTYVFYDSAHSTGTIDSVIELQGTALANVTKTDFV